jgi:hypothetical protein
MDVDSEAHLGPASYLAIGPLFVNAWFEAPRARELEAIGSAQLAAHEAHGKLAVVTVLKPKLNVWMDEATRDASAKLRRKLEPTYLSSAFFIDGSGFAAAAVRAALHGIHVMARADYPTKVAGDANEIATFTARALVPTKRPLSAETIVAAIARLTYG